MATDLDNWVGKDDLTHDLEGGGLKVGCFGFSQHGFSGRLAWAPSTCYFFCMAFACVLLAKTSDMTKPSFKKGRDRLLF